MKISIATAASSANWNSDPGAKPENVEAAFAAWDEISRTKLEWVK